jgi:hypothetical protein
VISGIARRYFLQGVAGFTALFKSKNRIQTNINSSNQGAYFLMRPAGILLLPSPMPTTFFALLNPAVVFYFISCIFVQIFERHGNTKKEYRYLVVGLFRFNRGFDCSHWFTLGVFNAHHSFCMHFFCEGHGHYVSTTRLLS